MNLAPQISMLLRTYPTAGTPLKPFSNALKDVTPPMSFYLLEVSPFRNLLKASFNSLPYALLSFSIISIPISFCVSNFMPSSLIHLISVSLTILLLSSYFILSFLYFILLLSYLFREIFEFLSICQLACKANPCSNYPTTSSVIPITA